MTTLTRRTSRFAAGMGIAASAVILFAGPAAATHTSQARATAAIVELLGASVLDTGEVVATNDGTGNGEVKTGSNSTTVLAGQTLLTAGVFAQDAAAGDDGSSAACAGAVGQGGIIQIGPAGGCVPTIGTPDGVAVNLNPGVASLSADAIYAECTDTRDGDPVGRATLVDANIFLLGQPLPTTLATAPAPNQGLDIPGIASLVLNEQTTNADGSLTVNALHITLLANPVTGSPAAEVIIGSVTCGIPVPDIDIFAGPAIPMALTGAAVVGATFFIRRRRQASA